MCGRYAAFRSIEEIRRLFGTTNPPPTFAPTWNMAPTRAAPVVRRHPHTGARHLDLLRWGLIPHWITDLKSARSPINARSETAASTPMFRDPLAHRRCLVPIDAFYEWQTEGTTKHPFAIARADDTPLIAAGLWEGWHGTGAEIIRSFTILTTTACPSLAHLHERMPVLLEPIDAPAWLGETDADPLPLMRPSTAEFRFWPVSQAVNNVRNDGPELLAPQA